jgi:antitoxin FitA
MADLLLRDIEPRLKRLIEESAKKNNRSLSDEAKRLIQNGLTAPEPPAKLGTYLFSLLEDKYRGDDLVFKRNDLYSPPPSFD